ncbi:MAG TPA: hypothetical protein VNO81_12110, partial [Candidatus Nitrosotenuis sp.]|nr:hypothetical protein [Candidatus Nitrosotenuis sp.]
YPQGGPAARQLLLHQLRHRLPPRGPRQPWQEALAACPLFLTPAGRPLSLAQLEEQRRRLGFVPVVAGRQGADPADLLVALLDHPLVEKILQAHFGKAMRDVEERLLAELARQANRQRWEQSPRPAELPPGRWLARRRLSDPPGEVGLEEEIRPPSLLQVLYQGRLLTSLEVDDGLDWTAVLDLAEVEILPDWSGPAQGPLWKAAWGRLQAEVETLYASLAALPLEQAGPRLLLAMSCGGRGEPYRSLPLFTDLTGRAWSVAELEGQEPWLVSRSCLPLLLRLPHHLLPGGPVLPVSPLEEQALRAQPLKVRDLAPLLERLQEVARALEQPQEPRIEEPCLVRLTWQEEDSRGELGLPLEAEPHQGRLRLLHRGVFLGERRLRHQGPGFLAVVDSARLTPNADWSSFAADGAWNELVRRVRQAAREAEERLLAELPARPGEAFRRALEALAAAHPQHPALQEAPLFAGVPEPLSPRRIRAEMEAHGHVLWGARGRGLPGRPFLLDSDPASLRLLERLCPGVRLRPLEEALQEVAPRPTLKLRVQGSVLARQALDPPRQGEVALTAEGGGDVAVYRQGRLQATVEGALPDGLRAVVEDPALGGGTSGAPWKALLEELGRTASRLIEGQLPRARPGSTLATALLSLSSWNLLEGAVRERLLAAPLIPMLAAPPLGLAALRERLKGRKTLPYTPAGPPVEPLDGRPVVRAPAAFATALARLCGCRAQDDRQELAQDRVYRWNLARARRLPTRLPACLQTLAVDGEGLRGEAGIPLRDPGRLVFCDDQGPMGSQLWPGPAMGAVLRGTFRLSRRGDQVLLSKEQERFLRRLCTDLYAALVDSLGPRPDADRRRRLLEFVRQERRSLGSRQATGELLARILRLPLVPAAQGAWVSLETLLQEARARGVLTYLAAPGPVPPGGEGAFPVLRRRSLERGVLAEMLGEERLVVARPGLDAWRAVRQAADRARQASSRFWGWLAGEGQELGA